MLYLNKLHFFSLVFSFFPLFSFFSLSIFCRGIMSSNSVCLNFRSSAKYNVGFCWYDEWQSLLQALKCYTMIAICKIKNFPFASKITGLKNVDFKTPQWNNGCWWIFFPPHTRFFMLCRIPWIKFHLKYAFVMQTKLLFKSSHQTATQRNSRDESSSFYFQHHFYYKKSALKMCTNQRFHSEDVRTHAYVNYEKKFSDFAVSPE